MNGLASAQRYPGWGGPAPAAAGAEANSWSLGLLVWLGALVSFPFYILSSGSMQISSVLLLLSALLVFLRLTRHRMSPFTPESLPLLASLGGFVAYAAVVSMVWAILMSDAHVAVTPVYYLFNLIVVMLILALYRMHGTSLVSATRWVILGSVALQFSLSFFFANRGFREILFFNNANQLGYYSLVCASILALPVKRQRTRWEDAVFSIGILMCTWLALLSLSKAATLSTLAFLVISGARNRAQIVMGALAATILLSLNIDVAERRLDNLTTRFETFGEEGGDDSLAGRGYDRIWENPQMLILGAGERANYRWDSFDDDGELHSSIGTVMFSYGIPGTLLMAAFLYTIARTGGWRIIPYMIPEFLYSLTHMGLRFVMTWVYFMMLFLVALEWRHERQQAAAGRLPAG